MQMIYTMMILERFADEISNGNMNFAILPNDIQYQKGDLINFKVADAEGYHLKKFKEHSLCKKTYEISYVLTGEGYGLRRGYSAIGIKLKEKAGD